MPKVRIDGIICTVTLTVNQFKKLSKRDYFKEVLPKLERAKAQDIDYDGHFGPNIFFTCAGPELLPGIMKVVEELIK